MEPRYEALKRQGDDLFGKRGTLLHLWQHLSEHFHPARATFTNTREIGAEMLTGLMTSYPVIARRTLGDAFGTMLRPASKEWFHLRTLRPEQEDTEARQWLEWMTGLMRNVMYYPGSLFTRATKEGDNDFATFGQGVLSVEPNRARNALLYRCWHLRDCAWAEGPEGQVQTVFRKWQPSILLQKQLFGAKAHPDVIEKAEKTPYDTSEMWHIAMPSEEYNEISGVAPVTHPYVWMYLDCVHEHVIEAVPAWTPYYSIPRWALSDGTQYAHSPATLAALPDGRLIQNITRVLLEAGEKHVHPPMIAVEEAIRSDISLYAGGITWVDDRYDERLGEVLRPVTQDKSGLGFGMDLIQDIRSQIAEAFYLNKLNLPSRGGPEMTAYEAGQRVQEFIRNALPLFEPMEYDYNGALCDQTFTLILKMSPEAQRNIPRSLQGAETQFTFESPLHEALEKLKANKLMEAQAIVASAAQLDPSVLNALNLRKATRDTLRATVPAAWLRPEAEEEQLVASQAAAAQAAQMLQMAQMGAEVSKTASEAEPTL